jgi:hypothetical protein
MLTTAVQDVKEARLILASHRHHADGNAIEIKGQWSSKARNTTKII